MVLIPWQDHYVIEACSPGTTASGGSEMDALLETDATRDLQRAMLIHIGEPPGMWRPGSFSRVAG
jgi:hypothetical protein